VAGSPQHDVPRQASISAIPQRKRLVGPGADLAAGRELRYYLGMPHTRYHGPPMTLANMGANGVRSLSVTCELCHHEAVMNVDAFEDATPVLAFGPRMVCTSCGIVGADARPNWQERAQPDTLTGVQWRAKTNTCQEREPP
jgi:hypothetical protein